jgi:hypothetical protein
VEEDQLEIDALAKRFYSLFTNTNGRTPTVHEIDDLFIEQGVIVKAVGETPEIASPRAFMEPRVALLTDGRLVNFEERETKSRTEIYGPIAQRLSYYEKSGTFNGAPYGGNGTKVMQFVKIGGRWRFSATAWFDD